MMNPEIEITRTKTEYEVRCGERWIRIIVQGKLISIFPSHGDRFLFEKSDPLLVRTIAKLIERAANIALEEGRVLYGN